MQPIFPGYSFKKKYDLSTWQDCVIRLLSNHKRYRILRWEFGPTLLDHLNSTTKHDYARNVLCLTYCIAILTAISLLALKRRAMFIIAVTLGITLLGVAVMVVIDTPLSSNEVINEKRCLELLVGLGKMPQYWWWPWGYKVEESMINSKQKERAVDYEEYSFAWKIVLALFTNVVVDQLRVAQYGYFYSYQELKGGKQMDNFTMFLSSFRNNRVQGSSHAELLPQERFSNLFRTLALNYDNDEMTLSKALESFDLKWLLMDFDISIKDVEGLRTKR